MRFVGLLSLVLILTSTTEVSLGQSSGFPYEARVVVDELFARSGAGEDWLPTQRLTRDTVVRVHRHDPGGWYMIEPPAGSFSWIAASQIERTTDQEGKVNTANSVAYVGSDFGEDTTVWQRRLAEGETVKILGQRKILTLSGEVEMLQIAPPRREFRWIPGSGVIPLDENRRRERDTNPYEPPNNTSDQSLTQLNQNSGGGVTDVPQVNPDSAVAKLQIIRTQKKQLADIDQRFREMLAQDPSQWNLDSLESEYRALQQTATHKPISGQIDLRYPAIERYRRKQAEFNDFRYRTSQTEMRDAELVGRLRNPNSAPPVAGLKNPTIAMAENSTHQVPIGAVPPAEDEWNFAPTSTPGPESMKPAGEPIQLTDAFQSFGLGGQSAMNTEPLPIANRVGAGIVQRTATGEGGSHVLMAPDGRLLAYLRPSADINLDLYLGQQVGVYGQRSRPPEYQADLIDVATLEAVRLRQQ